MKIKWLGHAAFLIESNGLRVITDPYDPDEIHLTPITEPADIIIRSSDDDSAHCFVDTIPAGYNLVTATDIVETGASAHGLDIKAIWSQESVDKDLVRDNAMYRFTLEGINFTHMGDVGNPLTPTQMEALTGTDVLLALTGGFPTIDLDDLMQVINTVKPRLIIPMHYRIPGPTFSMLPVTEFTGRFPDDAVTWINGTEVELNRDTLPLETRVTVLKPALVK